MDIKLSTAPGRSPFSTVSGRLARGKVISVTVLTPFPERERLPEHPAVVVALHQPSLGRFGLDR